MEADTTNSDALRATQGLASKLKALVTNFKSHQLGIIDLTDGDEALTVEQQELDDHNDRISKSTIRAQRLVLALSPQLLMDFVEP